MEAFRLRLVAVETEGAINLGFIARLVENFDVDEFYLVSPKTSLEEAERYAAKAVESLRTANIVKSLDEALKDVKLSFCSSAIYSSGNDVLRSPIAPWEMAEIAVGKGGLIALVVGRESTGLTRKEIEKCDLLVNIPSSSRYRSLNLSNATAIMLYELYKVRYKRTSRIESDENTLKLINAYLDAILNSTIGDIMKRSEAKIALSRILNKSLLSREESEILLYILSRTCRKIEGCLDAFEVPAHRKSRN